MQKRSSVVYGAGVGLAVGVIWDLLYVCCEPIMLVFGLAMPIAYGIVGAICGWVIKAARAAKYPIFVVIAACLGGPVGFLLFLPLDENWWNRFDAPNHFVLNHILLGALVGGIIGVCLSWLVDWWRNSGTEDNSED